MDALTHKVGLIVGYEPMLHRDAVGHYAEQLHSHMHQMSQEDRFNAFDVELVRFVPRSAREWLASLASLWNRYDLIHMQYPCEGWGTSIMPGVYPAFLRTARRKQKLVVTFHEWRSMHPLRKASVVPLALAADAAVFVSNHEHNGFLDDPWYRLRRVKPATTVIPMGLSVGVPPLTSESVLSARSELKSWNGVDADLVVGFFGFVYAWKQPEKMLEAIGRLHDRGVKARLVMAGDFLADHPEHKTQFFNRVQSLGLQDYVVLLGYVADPTRLATVLSACDSAVLLYADGLSARRSSFWYVLELGVPVVTTTASFADEFAGILDLDRLRRRKQVRFVDVSAHPDEIARALMETSEYGVPTPQHGLSPNWEAAAAQHLVMYEKALDTSGRQI